MALPNPTIERETPLAAIREALSCLVLHLAELPAKCSLALSVPGVGLVWLTTSRERAIELARLGAVVLTPIEFEALTLALADGRCTREDALQELRRKLANARHRIELAALLGAPGGGNGVVHPDPAGARWTVGDLASALSAELVEVRFEEQAQAQAQEGGGDGA
jgi:hypothetical protein